MTSNIIIENISTKDLDELLKIQKGNECINRKEHTKGFKILRNDYVVERLMNEEYSYFWQEGLRSFETQENKKDFNHEYDINILARKEDEIIGLNRLEWVYDSYGKDTFWNYKSNFLEVRNDHYKQGIAKKLLQHLEKETITQGKIIRFGEFSTKGDKYLKHNIEKTFLNKKHFILPKNSLGWQTIPKEFGCYFRKCNN